MKIIEVRLQKSSKNTEILISVFVIPIKLYCKCTKFRIIVSESKYDRYESDSNDHNKNQNNRIRVILTVLSSELRMNTVSF